MAPPHWPRITTLVRFAALAAALVVLLTPASASAANWLTPATTFAAPTAGGAQGYVDGVGNMTAVWQDEGGAGSTCEIRGVIGAGGIFQTATTISDGASVPNCGAQFELAASPNGDAAVVWTSASGVFAATRSAGAAWSAPTPLGSGSGYSDAHVAMNDSGDAVAVWLHAGGTQTLETSSFSHVSHNWTAGANIDSATGNVSLAAPSVGIDSSGNARSLWEKFDSTGAGSATLRSALGNPTPGSGADFQGPSSQLRYEATQIRSDGAAGHWLGAWRERNRTSSLVTLAAAVGSGTGALARDTGQFSGGDQAAIDPPGIAFLADGSAILVWSYKDGTTGNYSVNSLTHPAAAVDWTATGTAQNLIAGPPTAAVQFASTGSVVVDSDGRLQIVYESAGSVYGTQGASLSSLQLPKLLGSGSAPVMARGATYGAAIWNEASLVALSVFDPVPPTAPVITSPASVPAVEPATFSASATDVFGPINIEWKFGDGTTAGGPQPNGGQVTHTYAAAGLYAVTATAVDGGGNRTDNTITFQVTPEGGGAGSGGGGGALPPPTAGVNANVSVISGTVLVKVPGSDEFVPLTSATQLLLGSVIDARDGRVQITVADGSGNLLSGIAYDGQFVLQQNVGATSSRASQPKFRQTAAAKLLLFGGSFKGCKKAKKPRHSRVGSAAAKKKKKKKVIRQVWTKGNFQTQGKYAATVVRGTEWLTQDRCDGTLIKVRTGVVIVRDAVKHRNVVVRAHHQYLARSRSR